MIDGDVLESVGPEQGANDTEQRVDIVLGLAGVELTFFTGVRMVPCFGFVAKPVLITHQCVGCC